MAKAHSKLNLVPAGLVGVRRRENGCLDDYVGTAEALVAAGIIDMHLLPGQPGMPKIRIRFHGKKQRHVSTRFPNLFMVTREGAKFRVQKRVSEEEKERREAARRAAWEQRRAEEERERDREWEREWEERARQESLKEVTDEDIDKAEFALEQAMRMAAAMNAQIAELRARQARQQEAKRRPVYLHLVK